MLYACSNVHSLGYLFLRAVWDCFGCFLLAHDEKYLATIYSNFAHLLFILMDR